MNEDLKSAIAGLTLAEIDALLPTIAARRADLSAKEPTPELGPGLRVGTIFDPRWFSCPEVQTDACLLAVYDPRFGVLAYAFPRHEAQHLHKLIGEQLATPPVASGRPN